MSFLLPNIHIDHPVSIKQIPSIYTSYTYPQKYPTSQILISSTQIPILFEKIIPIVHLPIIYSLSYQF